MILLVSHVSRAIVLLSYRRNNAEEVQASFVATGDECKGWVQTLNGFRASHAVAPEIRTSRKHGPVTEYTLPSQIQRNLPTSASSQILLRGTVTTVYYWVQILLMHILNTRGKGIFGSCKRATTIFTIVVAVKILQGLPVSRTRQCTFSIQHPPLGKFRQYSLLLGWNKDLDLHSGVDWSHSYLYSITHITYSVYPSRFRKIKSCAVDRKVGISSRPNWIGRWRWVPIVIVIYQSSGNDTGGRVGRERGR